MYPYFWLCIAFCLNVAANLFVKQSNSLAHLGLLNGLIPTAYGRTLCYAIACLGVSFVFYTLAARSLPISLVYSVHVGMSLLIITTIAWYFMGETLSTVQYIGILFLFIAVTCIISPTIRGRVETAPPETTTL